MILTHFLALVGLPPVAIVADAGTLPHTAAPTALGVVGAELAPRQAMRVRTRAPVLPVRQP